MPFEVKVIESEKHPVILLRNEVDRCEAEIYALGALLNAFRIPIKKELLNIIDAYSSVAEAEIQLPPLFRSAKMSPFAGRIKNGEYEFNKHPYKIEKYYDGKNALHGVLYNAVYDIENVNADENKAEVILRYHYPGSDRGYPFIFDIQITWRLQSNNKLTVATTVQHHHSHSIPYAEGWHPYFNIGSNIDDCILQMDSDYYFQFDETLLPTGERIKDPTFKNGASLKGKWLDHCFELNKSERPKCMLKNDRIELRISPSDAYPFLQIYIPSDRKSVAIENISAAPDAFNNKIGLILIEPVRPAVFSTSYEVILK